jgi:uncharacterized coiled-coil protein SlyX
MPSVAELDRLKGRVSVLTPLTKVQTGELIKADDWNTVVSTLIEVAQTLVEEGSGVVPPHEHSDQVSVGWLDPRLRQLVEQGPLGDPAAVARVGALESRVDRLASSLDALADDVHKLRDLLTDVSTRDLAREAAVNTLHRTVGGLADARADVVDVRTTLGALQTQLQTVTDTAAALRQNGQPVDVVDLVNRVSRVEELRSRLTLPTGELLDTAEVQRQLATLQNTLVTQDELDSALASHHATIGDADRAALADGIRTNLLGDLQATGKQLSDQIGAQVGDRLAGLEADVGRAVSDAVPGVTQAVLGTIRPELETAAAGAVEQAGAASTKALADATAALRGELVGQIDDVRGSVATVVSAEVGRQLPGELAGLSTRIDSVEGRLAPVETRLALQEDASGTLAGRLDTLATEEAGERETLRQDLLATIDAQAGTLTAQMDTRFADAETATQTLLDTRLAESHDALLQQAQGLVGDQVGTLRGEIDGSISAAQDDLRAELGGRLDTVEQGAAATVAVELANQLPAQLEPLTGQLATLEARFAPLESQVASDGQALGALDARLSPVEATLAQEAETLGALTTQLAPLEADLETQKTALADLGSRLAPIAQTVESDIEALKALDTRLSPLEKTVASQETTLAAISERIEPLQTTLDAEQATLTALDTRISPLESQVRQVDVALKALDGRLSPVEKQVSTLRTQISPIRPRPS